MMKLAAAVLFLSAPQLYSAGLSIDSATGTAGETVKIPVTLRTDGSAISALQFDVEYDDAAMFVTAAIGPASAGADKKVSASDVVKNRKRVLIFGLNQTNIKDGVIVLLLAEVKPDAAPGEHPLKLLSASGSNSKGESIRLQTSGGGVTVSRTSAVKN
jgi:cohesin domain-containing protein